MSATLNRATIAAMAPGLRDGAYSLLLGAGVSLDSKNQRGDFLPTSTKLRDDLCKLKGAKAGSSLQRIFSSLTKSEVDEHVIRTLRVATAGPTVLQLTRFLWRRIFTFNIDDAVETAYFDPETTAVQTPLVINYDDEYSEWRDLSELPIVHLHGWVRVPGRGFVFSRAEYVEQITSLNAWMVNLAQFIPANPFIIAGTSLDEVDLEYYLKHRIRAKLRPDQPPSILIDPNPDQVVENECERYGLTLFSGTALEFFEQLSFAIPERPTPLELVPESTRQLFPQGTDRRTVISFSADFELVPTRVSPGGATDAFLYGRPPSWRELAGNVDVGRNLTNRVVAAIDKALSAADGPRLILVLDEPGSGKTTVLRRIAYTMSERSVRVLTCSALSRLDAESTATAINLIAGPILIAVDNFADQASAIADAALRLKKKDVVFLGAERGYRTEYLHQVLSSLRFDRIGGLGLKASEVDQLIDLYLANGLISGDQAIRGAKFRTSLLADPIAAACCRIMNDFHPLDRIIKSLLDAGSPKDTQRFLSAALAQYCFAGGIRYELLLAISGREGWDKQVGRDHPLRLSYTDDVNREFVVPTNTTIAMRVLEHSQPSALLPIFVELANNLAYRINRETIKKRTPEARLAGRLFNYDDVVKGFLKDDSEKFYEQTRDAWRWNSRYWEQVALLKLAAYYASPRTPAGDGALTLAVQHARHAVYLERHPLPLTTLGKVLLVRANDDSGVSEDVFDEAFERLTQAIAMEQQRWSRVTVQPFVTLFRGVRAYLKNGGTLSGEQIGTMRDLILRAKDEFSRDVEVQNAIGDVEDQMP